MGFDQAKYSEQIRGIDNLDELRDILKILKSQSEKCSIVLNDLEALVKIYPSYQRELDVEYKRNTYLDIKLDIVGDRMIELDKKRS